MFYRIITVLFLIICILSVFFFYKLSFCRKKIHQYNDNPILEKYINYYSNNNHSNNNHNNNNHNNISCTPNYLRNDIHTGYNRDVQNNMVSKYPNYPNEPRYNSINYVVYDTNPESLPPYPDTPSTMVHPNIPYTIDTPNNIKSSNCHNTNIPYTIDNCIGDTSKYATSSVYINNDGRISSVEQNMKKVVPVVPLSDPYRENKIVVPTDDMIPYDNTYGNSVVYTVPQYIEKQCPTCTSIPIEILEYANKHLDSLRNRNRNKNRKQQQACCVNKKKT